MVLARNSLATTLQILTTKYWSESVNLTFGEIYIDTCNLEKVLSSSTRGMHTDRDIFK